MKHFFALLLSALMVLSLLTACGDKTTPSDGDDQTVTDENGSDTDNNTDDTTDPYDAVRNYWSEDQLTQAWGPDQVVEHLFFHPIIAYPQWAFHDCNASQDQRYGLDDWMVTVDEYNKILQSVYDKGYILVAMEDVWSEVTDETGTHMVRNTLMLPEGKKPLVISFDDVNYYPYMLDEGFTSKLVVGEDGEIWAQCTDPYTNETFLTKELDATPILDQFVYEHPDFSLNGAKAIFSLTGYQGILGYRTRMTATLRQIRPTAPRSMPTARARSRRSSPSSSGSRKRVGRSAATPGATSASTPNRSRPSSTTPSAGRPRSARSSAPRRFCSIRTAAVPTVMTGTRPASASSTCKARASASSRASARVRSAM